MKFRYLFLLILPTSTLLSACNEKREVSVADQEATATVTQNKEVIEAEPKSDSPWFAWPFYLFWNTKTPTYLKFRLPPWHALEFKYRVPTPWDVLMFLTQFTFIYTLPILIQIIWVCTLIYRDIIEPNVKFHWNADHYFEDPYKYDYLYH